MISAGLVVDEVPLSTIASGEFSRSLTQAMLVDVVERTEHPHGHASGIERREIVKSGPLVRLTLLECEKDLAVFDLWPSVDALGLRPEVVPPPVEIERRRSSRSVRSRWEPSE